jgi:uncharacterized protein
MTPAPDAPFTCRRCGACCRQPGYVRVAPSEFEAAAALLGMATVDFVERYTRLHPDRRGLCLTETADGSCVFLEGSPAACRIQAAKPAQCRDYPIHWGRDNAKAICAAMRTRA